jgi:microcystin degradation protein MlrC
MPHLHQRDIAQKAIMALSPGFTNLLLEQLPYRRIIRPIFPLDGDFEWDSTIDGKSFSGLE